MANNCWHTWKPFFKMPKYPYLPQLTQPNRNPLLMPLISKFPNLKPQPNREIFTGDPTIQW